MPDTLERRRFGRRDVRKFGWVVIPGRPRIACVVQNLSKGGAFLSFAPPKWLPFRFDLVSEDDGGAITCELRHCRLDGVGVDFVDLAEKPGAETTGNSLNIDSDAWLGHRPQGNSVAVRSTRKSRLVHS
jgi:PilZ domain